MKIKNGSDLIHSAKGAISAEKEGYSNPFEFGGVVVPYVSHKSEDVGYTFCVLQQIKPRIESKRFGRLLEIEQYSYDDIEKWRLTFNIVGPNITDYVSYKHNKEIATLMDKLFRRVSDVDKPFQIWIDCAYNKKIDGRLDKTWKLNLDDGKNYFKSLEKSGIPKSLEFILERLPKKFNKPK